MDRILNLLVEPQLLAVKWLQRDLADQLDSDISVATDKLSTLASYDEKTKQAVFDDMAQAVAVALPGIVNANLIKLRSFLENHPTISNMPKAATDHVINGFVEMTKPLSE